MGRLTENVMINIKNKSHAVTAQVEVPEGGATGVVSPRAARSAAGRCTSTRVGRRTATTCSACAGSRSTADAAPAGAHQLRLEFAYDGGGLAKGGTASLWVDGAKVGEGRVDATQPMVFSGDETADVGSDTGSRVSDDYRPETSPFTGTVRWIQIDLGEDADDADHLITPEERLRVAMARQ